MGKLGPDNTIFVMLNMTVLQKTFPDALGAWYIDISSTEQRSLPLGPMNNTWFDTEMPVMFRRNGTREGVVGRVKAGSVCCQIWLGGGLQCSISYCPDDKMDIDIGLAGLSYAAQGYECSSPASGQATSDKCQNAYTKTCDFDGMGQYDRWGLCPPANKEQPWNFAMSADFRDTNWNQMASFAHFRIIPYIDARPDLMQEAVGAVMHADSKFPESAVVSMGSSLRFTSTKHVRVNGSEEVKVVVSTVASYSKLFEGARDNLGMSMSVMTDMVQQVVVDVIITPFSVAAAAWLAVINAAFGALAFAFPNKMPVPYFFVFGAGPRAVNANQLMAERSSVEMHP